MYTPQRLPLTVTFSHRGTLADDAPAVAVAPEAATPHAAISATAAARLRVALNLALIVDPQLR
jgi:hypothetical protein